MEPKNPKINLIDYQKRLFIKRRARLARRKNEALRKLKGRDRLKILNEWYF
ncbi:hypothetical protein SAMN05660772_02292 [Pasteurella testudinis DSM 23072]|uniref:Uncharacterized protein n=1 Tax=Pasteurella testudinis DSM 23072 TaxID=1122938 RepID=A0A1W1UTU8_9PAST|nr:hypothetical protein [Pasteurella testudinis]SMB84470.1 hypothetical protein SAMN05660772_02292 [Pasteurella testudinis DSM 23072]SUB50418.1 Uncharacterised protein [Pasteurella testudinis]